MTSLLLPSALFLLILAASVSVQAQVLWQPINAGLDRANARIIRSGSDGTLYVGTTGGLYRSTDRGDRWDLVLPLSNVISLVIDSSGVVTAGSYSHIYRSDERGEVWSLQRTNDWDSIIRVYAADRDGILYGVGTAGLQRSSDGGRNWTLLDQQAPYFQNDFSQFSGGVAPDGALYIGGVNGTLIARSTDQGNSWTDVGPPRSEGIYAAGFVALEDGTLFVGTPTGLYRSTDGIAWERIDNVDIRHLVTDGKSYVAWGTTAQGSGPDSIRLRVSSDRGQTWSEHMTMEFWSMGGDREGLYGYRGHELYRSDDMGKSWKSITRGLTNFNVSITAVSPTGTLYTALPIDRGQGSLYKSTDHGAEWSPVSDTLFGTIEALLVESSGNLLAGENVLSTAWEESGRILISTDNGASWMVAADSIDGSVTSLVQSPNTGIIYAGSVESGGFGTTGGGVYRSDDGGRSWRATGLIDAAIRAIAIGRDGAIIAGRYETSDVIWEGAEYYGQIYRSTDDGESWTAVSDEMGATALVAAPSGTILAAIADTLLRSIDNGITWQTLPFNFPFGNRIGALTVDSAGAFYLGMDGDGGIFRSTDDGSTWEEANEGLNAGKITSLMTSPKGYVVAGTVGFGLHRTDAIGEVPPVGTLGLRQNHPNPFIEGTIISFVLHEPRFISMKVYDMAGKEVVTLIDADREAGSYAVRFDASGLSAGVYTCIMNAGIERASIKMTVLGR